MPVWLRWVFGVVLVLVIAGLPFAHYRASYAHGKRLREVTSDKFYRCGQLTADGFREAIKRFHIRTVINLQQEAKDPLLPNNWQGTPTILESAVCAELGVNYVQLDGGVLDYPPDKSSERPEVIEQFLEIMDDYRNLPVLIHCRAGLHRTGLMVAVYRMEYEGWSKAEATLELRANGFGTYMATEENPYLMEYIAKYEPGFRRGKPISAGAKP